MLVLDFCLQKLRPAHLTLSPSDGALKTSVTAGTFTADTVGSRSDAVESGGHVSDGETAPKSSTRRRLFGRSHESVGSSRHSKDMSPTASPSLISTLEAGNKEKEKEGKGNSSSSRHAKGKKSADGSHKSGGERLSIFGGAFTGPLTVKGRKPPPSR